MNPGIAFHFVGFVAGYFFSKTLDGFLDYFKPYLPGVIPPIDPTPPRPGSPVGGDVYPDYATPWRGAGATPARVDPLVLDLNKDGKVELKNAAFLT